MKDGQIVQVAYVVRDLDASLKRHWEVFGIGPWDIYLFESPKVENYLYRGKPATHKALIAVTWPGPVQLEVMQPVSGRCIYDEHLETKGEGLHHIKLYYADCDKAVQEYERRGYGVLQSGKFDDASSRRGPSFPRKLVWRPGRWGEIPVADLKRRHLKAIIASMSDRPHAARRWLIVIRKMIGAALDEEWIESDPAHRLKYRPPPTHGWRAWTWPEMKAFEDRWPIGSTPRLCYALTLWLGPRRKDVAALATASIDGDSITFTTHKTGRVVSGHITPMLREVLDAADLSGPTILKTTYGLPFSEKSLTGRMADWTQAAGLPKGCTIHGLRKTLGALIADSGGSSRQAMAALGHDDLKQVELYSEASDRRMQARDAMMKVTAMVERRKAAG